MDGLDASQEILYKGWLVKSPPTKLWRGRWRRRWFILCRTGEFPGFYFLEYYTDRHYKKLKGRIELDQCEQVDAGIRFENCKPKYQHIFSIRTPKRKYYLAPDTEDDMNRWVKAICHVCGLKPFSQHKEYSCQTLQSESQVPLSVPPRRCSSGPYIPLSECISGRRLCDTNSTSASPPDQEYYDAPRKLAPSPTKSCSTDDESTFTDDESTTSSIKWDDFSSSTLGKDEIGACSIKKRFGKLKIVDSATKELSDATESSAPPRPPKPLQLSDNHTEDSKFNATADDLELSAANTMITDESYDFPRCHQPGHTPEIKTIVQPFMHIYSNAASAVIEGTVDTTVSDIDKDMSSKNESLNNSVNFEQIINQENVHVKMEKFTTDDVAKIVDNEVYLSATECRLEMNCFENKCDINEDSNL